MMVRTTEMRSMGTGIVCKPLTLMGTVTTLAALEAGERKGYGVVDTKRTSIVLEKTAKKLVSKSAPTRTILIGLVLRTAGSTCREGGGGIGSERGLVLICHVMCICRYNWIVI
jgi:hypothetical protein